MCTLPKFGQEKGSVCTMNNSQHGNWDWEKGLNKQASNEGCKLIPNKGGIAAATSTSQLGKQGLNQGLPSKWKTMESQLGWELNKKSGTQNQEELTHGLWKQRQAGNSGEFMGYYICVAHRP